LFPALTGTNYFYATLVDSLSDIEIVKVTARSTDTLTVVRGQEGTTPTAFASGSKIELRVTAAGLANKVAYDDGTFAVAQSQVTGLVAALAAITAKQFTAGTRTVFHQAAAPTGWTQDTSSSYNDITLRIVTGAGHGGYSAGQAFSTAVAAGTVGTHSLTQAELPNCTFPIYDPGHEHPIRSGSRGGDAVSEGGSLTGGSTFYTDAAATNIQVYSGGSGAAHPHTFTGGALNLNYTDFILCQKN
jgi:hypothetical protein